MTLFIQRILEKIGHLLESGPLLARAKPLFDAIDSFLLSRETVTPAAPHIRDAMELKRFMILVVAAAMPLALFSIYQYGWRAVAIILVSYLCGVGAEAVFVVARREEFTEGAFVSCMLYPLTLPPTIPLWMAGLGIIVGIVFGKEVFGGTGKNIFNPALVGRVFIAVAFPVEMTTRWLMPASGGLGRFTAYTSDTVTGATPLIVYKGTRAVTPVADLFFGNIPGSLGEGCKILILAAGLFLILTRIVNWRLPVSMLGAVWVASYFGSALWPERIAPPMFQLLSGGLLFGAVFMVTDPVTCPVTRPGKYIYGVLCGLLTVLIRNFSGYVEGVMFAILFMNIFAPLIDETVFLLTFREKRASQ
ncbi:MAG: RnfABCDGE type electron transport complex subunit D [Candidatus Omnitrophica bacterium]|nr:RnfABCDGE type electron transport complex subunit D [Candidatus Omnitrophota bacterium]